MRELPHTRSCFVCGDSNRLGLRLRFYEEGDSVRSTFTPRIEHAGFRGVIHGGLLATVLDEIMVWACAVRTKRFAYCAELNVRYRRPAKPQVPLSVAGRLVQDRRGRILEAVAELRDPSGQMVATATGKYMPLGEDDARTMMEDFVGDRSGLPGS